MEGGKGEDGGLEVCSGKMLNVYIEEAASSNIMIRKGMVDLAVSGSIFQEQNQFNRHLICYAFEEKTKEADFFFLKTKRIILSQ